MKAHEVSEVTKLMVGVGVLKDYCRFWQGVL